MPPPTTIEVKNAIGPPAHSPATIEDEDNDVFAPQKDRAGGSVPAAVFNLTKTVVGAGIFTMPSALNEGGFVLSLVMILLMSYIVCWTMQLLVKTGVSQNILDYRVLMEDSMGKWGSVLYFVSAFVYAYGICIAYSIVAADTIPAVIGAISGVDYDKISTDASDVLKIFLDRRVMITITSVVILYPVSSLRYLKHMAITSFVGLFMFLWAALTAMVISRVDLPDDLKGTQSIFTIAKADGIPGLLSRVAFSSVSHHGQFVIYRSIKNTSLKKYNLVARISIATSAISSCIFGAVCFAQLSEKAAGGNVLNYLPSSDIWVQIAKFAFFVDVALTYPIELFISRDLIVRAIHGQDKIIKTPLRLLYSAVLVLGTMIISVLLCDLNDIVDFTGGVAASMVAFVLPVLAFYMYERRKGDPINYFKLIPHILVLLFGITMVVITIVLILPRFKIDNSNCPHVIL